MSHAKIIFGLVTLGAGVYAFMRFSPLGTGSSNAAIPVKNNGSGFLSTAENDYLMTIKQWTTPKAGLLYEPLFLAATLKYGLPAGLLSRQCYQESRYNPKAFNSGSKAAGLMQFIPTTAKEFGIDPYNPTQAIDAGGKYLAQLYKRFGSWKDALAAYNWGQGNLAKKGITAAPLETRNYTAQILADIGLIV